MQPRLLDERRDVESVWLAQCIDGGFSRCKCQTYHVDHVEYVVDTYLKQCLHKCVIQDITVMIDLATAIVVNMVGAM